MSTSLTHFLFPYVNISLVGKLLMKNNSRLFENARTKEMDPAVSVGVPGDI